MHAVNFTMTFRSLTVSLYIPFVHASLSSFNGICTHTLSLSDSPSSSDTRTLVDIIWSCAATLFACTWTAIHPNIPGTSEGKFAIVSRRLFVLVIALIAPELIITWAARQFFSARKAANDFNGAEVTRSLGHHRNITGGTLSSPSAVQVADPKFTGWTATHGFFAWMGGFLLCANDRPRVTLTPDELLRFVCDGSVAMPDIAQEDIEDRSKGDALSKGISILQLVWFVVSLAARYIQNLPITLLELDTLAIAALTCIASSLWWKKPKDVGRPYLVHWKAAASPPRDLDYDKADAELVAGDLFSHFYYLVYPFLSLMTFQIISPRAVHSRRVPSLGGYARTHGGIILLIGCCSGMVFGGIHCAGWHFSFHGHTEQTLWRAASLAILCAPVSIILSYIYEVSSAGLRYLPSIVHRKIQILLETATWICSFLYIAARITLIVLMLMSLRSLPSGVYDTVAWTKFIPHI